ncbi:MAG: methylmalonyl-CoA mutase, partial [Thermoanaerobacteraceae bacterium]|nr:methylmalonyl-CoA mutase [Thermoanaerobacteraceae bacterium]
ERFKAENPKSMMLRFHTQTAGSTLTAQQPDNNIVRVAIQALAAVLGGTQSLHTNSRDEALALPTEDSVRIALRTQQIIAYESGVAETVDPLAGSYYVEYLTNTIEQKAMEYIEKIDKLGGAPKAIEKGFVQQEIQNSAYNYQMEIEQGKKTVVGVNKFQIEEDSPRDLLKVDPLVGKLQEQKIKHLKASRDNVQVSAALQELKDSAKTDKNLMPIIIKCVKAYCTLGEICDTLRVVFGEYKASINI